MQGPTPPDGPAGTVRWVLYGLALFGLFSAWSVASPLFSVPDEPAHVIKAVAIARGQLWGAPGTTATGQDVVRVRVPERLADGYRWPGCYNFEADVTADCAPDELEGGTHEVVIGTPAGGYPPLYYAVVGWPSRLSTDAVAVRGMRLVSAAVCAALVTAAAWALARVTGRPTAMAAGLFVVTPMTAFLAGSVNPNGLEIAAATATWAAALAVARRVRDERPLGRGLVVVVAVGGATLALTRWLSPLYLVAVLALAAMSVPLGAWRGTWRRRDLQGVAGVLGASLVVAGALILAAPARDLSPGPAVPAGDGALEALVGQTGQYLENMIGRFGWVDVPPPLVAELVWVLGLGAIVGLALVVADRPVLRALGLTAVATFVLPIAAQLPSTETLGMPWQGRYTLPLAVGVPLLALVGVAERVGVVAPGVPAGRRRVLVGALAGAAAVGHVAALVWALRRYGTGLHGSLDLLGDAAWAPPGGHLVVILAATAACAVAVACAVVPDAGPARRART